MEKKQLPCCVHDTDKSKGYVCAGCSTSGREYFIICPSCQQTISGYSRKRPIVLFLSPKERTKEEVQLLRMFCKKHQPEIEYIKK